MPEVHTYGNVRFTYQDNLLGGTNPGYKITGLPRVTWLALTRSGPHIRCDYDVNFCLGEPILLDPCDDLKVTLEQFVDRYLEDWRAQINKDVSMYQTVEASINQQTNAE